MFHTVSNMADVILGNNAQKAIEPPIGNKTYTTLNELFQIIDPDFYADEEPEVASYYERVLRLLKTMETGSDPIFDDDDMLPFFMINFF